MERLPSKDVVLIGAGHTNLHVVRMWGKSPIPDVRLTLVSPTSVATYSGMLPGTLAGLYEPHEMLIDLHQLTQQNEVRLILSPCEGIDPGGRSLKLAGRPDIRFDAASVGVGSIPTGPELVRSHPGLVSIKPMFSFPERLNNVVQMNTASPLRVTVAGAGAAGVEVAFCVQQYLKRRNRDSEITLIDANQVILKNYHSGTRRIAETELSTRGIRVLCERRIVGCRDRTLLFHSGEECEADVILWCVGASPPALLNEVDLPKSQRGFLLTEDTLQTVAGDPVFAVGDSGEMQHHPVPRAGVFAVRQGPILWDNLQRLIAGRPLTHYRPQRDFLSLLATGDGNAILQWRGISSYGQWCWRLKNWIDQKFLRMHRSVAMTAGSAVGIAEQRREPAATSNAENAVGARRMRCRGCGGKTSGRVLRQVLNRLRLEQPGPPDPLFLQPEDAAMLAGASGPVNVVSVDFFQAFLDDPWLTGRIAALHSLSDLWARGVTPKSAVAMITLPEGSTDQQSELLYQLLSGGIREMTANGATLVGGHTVDGDSLSVGFTVLGQTNAHGGFSKSGLRPGDRLVLTQPIGTGVILAANSMIRASARSMDTMIESMLLGNASASQIAQSHGVTGVTDVTGFGLAGHLLELLEASHASARIGLSKIPLLHGAADYLSLGIRSSLDDENRWIEHLIHGASSELKERPEWAALFDPQTSGGLLLAVPQALESRLLRELQAAGYHHASTIGEVTGAVTGAATQASSISVSE